LILEIAVRPNIGGSALRIAYDDAPHIALPTHFMRRLLDVDGVLQTIWSRHWRGQGVVDCLRDDHCYRET
jgi:hypothetical protein